jgi:hypothetical protein
MSFGGKRGWAYLSFLIVRFFFSQIKYIYVNLNFDCMGKCTRDSRISGLISKFDVYMGKYQKKSFNGYVLRGGTKVGANRRPGIPSVH